MTSITIGNSVTSIGDEAFSNCVSLIDISIPNQVSVLGAGAFKNCTNLESVKLGAGLTVLKYATFYNCTSLKSIVIPNNITEIEEVDEEFHRESLGFRGVFENCENLKTIKLGNGIKVIGDYAFYNCKNVDTIYCMAKMPPKLPAKEDWSWGLQAFVNVNKDIPVFVPCNRLAYYVADDSWNMFSNMQEDCTIDGFEAETDTISDSNIKEVIGDNAIFSVYPNPAHDVITLDIGHLTLDKNETASIANNSGKVVYKSNVQSSKFNINVSDFEAGFTTLT